MVMISLTLSRKTDRMNINQFELAFQEFIDECNYQN